MNVAQLAAISLIATTALVAQDEPRFEVLVLGTYHAPVMFRSDAYTPAHIRATLALAEPDVVAVECHPTWFANGRYHVVTYEAEGTAVPFARERGLPVWGVDWKDIDAWDRREQLQALREGDSIARSLSLGHGLSLASFGASMPAEQAGRLAADARAVDWRQINSVEFGRSRYAGSSPDDEDFAAERDRRIAANCIDVMRTHPGERLVVVIGAHHKPYLEILLGRHAGITVLRSGEQVPYPDAAQVDAAWTTTDLLATLGHELDAGPCYFRPELARPSVAGLLERLEQLGEAPAAARYFRARVATARGDTATAAKLLDGLIAERPIADVYPFPMREWHMRYTLDEAARVERARLLLASGDEQRARELLAPVQRALTIRVRDLERSRPRETRHFEAIDDPGFERGRGADIFDGWSGYVPTGHGRLRYTADAEQHIAGQRSLRLDIAEPNPVGYGFVVRQEIELPPDAVQAGKRTWSVAARVQGLTRARVEIAPAWSSQDRTAIATKELDVGSDDWQRVELAFSIPADGQFAIHFAFDGPAGSALWLDDGAPMTAGYVTRPREWSYLVRAREFPGALLAPAQPQAAAPARRLGPLLQLGNAGFDAAQFSSSTLGGWFCTAVQRGSLAADVDTANKAEGTGSLRFEVRVAEGEKPPATSISQVFASPTDAPRLRLSLASRGRPATLTVGYWTDDQTFHRLGKTELRQDGDDWARHQVEVDVPAGVDLVGMFVWFPREAGARVWLDDARVERIDR